MERTNLSKHQLRSPNISGTKTLSYYEMGEGIPLILLHGIGSSGASWATQCQILSNSFRVVAWNAPGYGQSEPFSHTNPSPKDYARVLDELVAALGFEKFYLIGHSLGALIAGAYSRLRAEKVHGLILLDPAQGYGRAPKQVRKDKLDSRIQTFNKLGARGLAEARGPKLLSSQAPEKVVKLVCSLMAQLNTEGYLQASQMLANGDLLTDVALFEGEALVLCGTEDQITPPARAREVAAAMQKAVYMEIEGVGHASYIEAPELFAQYLTDFIQRTKLG